VTEKVSRKEFGINFTVYAAIGWQALHLFFSIRMQVKLNLLYFFVFREPPGFKIWSFRNGSC